MRGAWLIGVLVLASSAWAGETKWYAGAGAGSFKLRAFDATPPAFTFQGRTGGGFIFVGAELSRHLAGELRLGATGDTAATQFVTPTVPFTVDAEVDTFVSYLARVTSAESRGWSAYALLGATTATFNTRISFLGTVVGLDDTDTSFTWGGGIQKRAGDSLTAGLEWVRYYDDDDTTVDGLSATARFRF